MKLEAVVKLFQNITIREEAHGIPNAFRFKAILSSRKQGTLCEARYDGGVAESEPRPASGPVPGRRAEPQSSIVTSGSSPTLIQQQLLLAPYSFNTIHRPIIQSTADLPPAPAPAPQQPTGLPVLDPALLSAPVSTADQVLPLALSDQHTTPLSPEVAIARAPALLHLLESLLASEPASTEVSGNHGILAEDSTIDSGLLQVSIPPGEELNTLRAPGQRHQEVSIWQGEEVQDVRPAATQMSSGSKMVPMPNALTAPVRQEPQDSRQAGTRRSSRHSTVLKPVSAPVPVQQTEAQDLTPAGTRKSSRNKRKTRQ
jgi:hypothetical protein